MTKYTVAPIVEQDHGHRREWQPWLLVVEYPEDLEPWKVTEAETREYETTHPLTAAIHYLRATKQEFAHVCINTDTVQGEYVVIPVDGHLAIYNLSKAENWDYWETKNNA